MFGVAMETGSKQALSPESAAALDLFDQFVNAQTFKAVLGTFRLICETLRIKPTNVPNFYPKLKAKLRSWKAQALWAKFDKRASHKCYNRGKACANTRVLVIGAGPCGLRTAIEAQLLGAKVVVVEKRDRFSRNNVLHLWPFVIHDLRNLGAKKFYGKFCAGAIDHISIRQIQCVLLKVALLLGVEVHENVSFEDLIEPPTDQSQEKIGWKASLSPKDHAVAQYEFDVLIGADGKRNTLKAFKRKEFRGKLAIAITANFINRHSEEEARVQEISGIAFIFNQKFFQDLYEYSGIDLENIVYYKDETHYFVMTAKKYSLIEKGVILNDYADTARLLGADNVNRDALLEYAREAADFSTNFQMPHLEFAVNHYGQADVAMFDFTSMFAAESACRIVERRGHKLLQALVGDSLLEPFWPTGSGCARGFLSSLDACWMIRSWSVGFMTPLQVLAERESIYRLLAQTTPENLSKDSSDYTLNPSSRYPNLNSNAVRPTQVKGLYDTDGELNDEPLEMPLPKRKRKRDSFVHPDTLLNWCQRQVILYKDVSIENMNLSWKNGLAICAIIHRYRPDLIEFHSLKEDDAETNNQLAFDVCEREFGILPVMTGKEMAESAVPDALAIMSYISQIYDNFRGEIPYVARAPLSDLSPEERPSSPSRKSPVSRFAFFSRIGQRFSSKKRYSVEKMEKDRALGLHQQEQERDKEIADAVRRAKKRRSLERDRALFILNKNSMTPNLTSYKKTEASMEDRENFVTRVKDLEEKLYGVGKKYVPPTPNATKVGKIGRGDWNVKMLEERLKGNKASAKKDKEEVPKWNRDIFEDKLRTMDQKLRSDSPEEPAKYTDFDSQLRMLDKKLKEGNNLETGQRGMNKVSAMAEHLSATLETRPQSLPLQRSNSKTTLIPPQTASEMCHFCNKRVYLMERHSAQGKFFHRGCFKCECCGVSLRLGNYGIGTEVPYNGKFLCMHHFNMRVIPKKRPSTERESEAKKSARVTPTKASSVQKSPGSTLVVDSGFEKSRGVTPERVEFENSLELTSEEELLSEIDEDEFTERNFGNSASDFDSTDEESDFSSDEMADEAREELEEALHNSLSSDQTIRLAETWNRRHFKRNSGLEEDDDVEEETDEDYGESGEDYSYEEYENEDDESTATEGEVQDGAGEGPSENVASSADELEKDGDVQLTIPRQANKSWETDDYHKLRSNDGTGTEEEDDSGSKTSDSELYSDTETDSESRGDEEEEEKGSEGDEESGDDKVYFPERGRRKGKHKHFIPTIVIDEMTASAPNEDDDSYFTTLQEQSLQAERTLEDLIQEQITESAVQSPETPSVVHYIEEEICPLVSTATPKTPEVICSEEDKQDVGNLTEEMDGFEKTDVCVSEDQIDGNEITTEHDAPSQDIEKFAGPSDFNEELASPQTVTSNQLSDSVGSLELSTPKEMKSVADVHSIALSPSETQREFKLPDGRARESVKSPRPHSFVASARWLEQMEKKIYSVADIHDENLEMDVAASEKSSSQELLSSPDIAKVKENERDRSTATESPTAKMMLKLKERYLLGNVSSPESSSFSSLNTEDANSTKLEPVVRNFLEIISEKQKMLSPAPSPSPSSLQRPVGLNFGEISPSSPTSMLSSSSEPSHLQVGSSSSLSRISPISPLSTGSCATSPSPSSDPKLSSSLSLDKELASQTLINNTATEEQHLMKETCESHDDDVANGNLKESPDIEVEGKIKITVSDTTSENDTLTEEHDKDSFLQDTTFDDVQSGNSSKPASLNLQEPQQDNGGTANVSKDEILTLDFEKVLPEPPFPPTVAEIYADTSDTVQLNPDNQEISEDHSPIENIEFEAITLNELNDKEKSMEKIENAIPTTENLTTEIHSPEGVTNEMSPLAATRDNFEDLSPDASHLNNIDTRFITFRDKSKSSKAQYNISDILITDSSLIELETGTDNVQEEIAIGDVTVPEETDVILHPILQESEGNFVKEEESVTEKDRPNVNVYEKVNEPPKLTYKASSHFQHNQMLNDQNFDDATKSDDELLEMLSASVSSDSDTTPSLDESLYTTPETMTKLSSKFGSYSSHFSEHSFPFGGVRDSIDIRKSAMKRYPGCTATPLTKLHLHDVSLNDGNGSETISDETLSSLLKGKTTSEKVVQGHEKITSAPVEEIPFADDESSQESSDRTNKKDQYFTPRTSHKRTKQRPLSMTETWTSTSSPLLAAKNNVLPDTPLTNPEMFSTPGTMGEAIEDLRQLRTVEREKARQLARERARLKSDEELGLRTVDYANLRKKYQKSESLSSDIQEENNGIEVEAPEGQSFDIVSDKAEASTTPDSVGDSGDVSPGLEMHPESSSPDSEVFEVCSPLLSPCNKEKAPVSQASESSDQVSKSNTDTSPGTTTSPSEIIKTSDSNSNSTPTTSKTDCASYLEPELTVDDVGLKISPESHDTSSSTPSIVASTSKVKSSSLPGLISRNKSKSQKNDSATAADKPDKSKSKERKSLLSIFANFGSKNKDKEEKEKEKKKDKSPHSSTSSAPGTESQSPTNPLSPLEGAIIKVDGTPKESRFPKLRLARSKEKAKEKRKQKYLMDSQKEGSQSPSPPKEMTTPSESTVTPVECLQMSLPPPPPLLNEGAMKSNTLPAELKAACHIENKSSEITLDRHALIASMASISKQIPSSGKLRNGVAPQASEDSFSDPEEDTTEEKSQASTSGSVRKTKDLTEERKRKYQKLAQRMYRQQEQKRLRTAQEIQRQLEELEVKQREHETRGVVVEKALRGEGEGSDAHKGEPELMKEWFQLVHDKNVLVRHEQELMVKAKELELEDRHSRLQHELHQRMAVDDAKKTPEQIEEEGNILAEMLEIVEQRDTLIALLEENRQRHQEEDRDFELSMQGKGMRFLSFSKS